MAELRTAIALGAAAATFAVGAVVASSMSGSPAESATRSLPDDRSGILPEVGDHANEWHLQTAVASYESRLLRYAQDDALFTGARFAFKSRSFILYGSGRPSAVVRRMLQGPPAGVEVSWIRVPYSRDELDRAVRDLRRVMPARSVVEYAPNYGGILVGLHPLPSTPGQQASLYGRAQEATDIPVTFLQAGFADPM